MTALLAFLRFAWPYMVCCGIGFGVGDYLEGNHWQAKYDAYQATVAQQMANAEKAANSALQAQIQARLTTEANNGKIISQLTQERDSVAADRDFARRLLAAAQARPAPSHSVPATPDRRGPDDPSESSGDRSLAQDLGDAAGECRAAIQRLAALQAELAPQLSR